jgi:hypothetical protein
VEKLRNASDSLYKSAAGEFYNVVVEFLTSVRSQNILCGGNVPPALSITLKVSSSLYLKENCPP